mgnify:CR=1 FL=1
MLDPARMDDVLRRGGDVATVVASWRSLDDRRKKLQAELDTKRGERNAANERMSKLDKKSDEFAAAREELKTLATVIKEGETELATLETTSQQRLLHIPNAPHASVPDGNTEADNRVLHTTGTKPTFAFTRLANRSASSTSRPAREWRVHGSRCCEARRHG